VISQMTGEQNDDQKRKTATSNGQDSGRVPRSCGSCDHSGLGTKGEDWWWECKHDDVNLHGRGKLLDGNRVQEEPPKWCPLRGGEE